MLKNSIAERTIFWDIIQNTEEWDDIRAGMITSSAFNVLEVNGKQEYSLGVGGVKLLDRILEERTTGTYRQGGWSGNKDTEYGHTNEPLAAERYEYETFQHVRQCGFIAMNDWLGCSPDRLVGDDGMLQIKCFPVEHVGHVRALKNGSDLFDVLKKDLRTQTQFELWAAGRKWNDIVFFKPTAPKGLDYYVKRLYADEDRHQEFAAKTTAFVEIVIKEASKLGFELE